LARDRTEGQTGCGNDIERHWTTPQNGPPHWSGSCWRSAESRFLQPKNLDLNGSLRLEQLLRRLMGEDIECT